MEVFYVVIIPLVVLLSLACIPPLVGLYIAPLICKYRGLKAKHKEDTERSSKEEKQPDFRIEEVTYQDGHTVYITQQYFLGNWRSVKVRITDVHNRLHSPEKILLPPQMEDFRACWHTKEEAEAAIEICIEAKKRETVVGTKYEYYTVEDDTKVTQMERIIKDLEAELEKVKGEKNGTYE